MSFISIKEEFDTSIPMGNAMLMISSVFAQLERDTITERIRDNILELAKTGRWLGSTTPTGYVSEGKRKGIIDGIKWIEVQDLLSNNGSKNYCRPTVILKGDIKFSGIEIIYI